MNNTPDMSPQEEKEYYDGDKSKIVIPETHFPDVNGEWILVHDGKHLPELNQEILYVVDIRGSQQEFINSIMNWPMVDQKVLHGYVDSIDFHEGLDKWSIAIRSLERSRNLSKIDYGEHITYWRPMPLPPPDTYKRHSFGFTEVFNIVQEKLLTMYKSRMGKS